MSNKAAFVESAKEPTVVREAEIEQLREGKVLIKVNSKLKTTHAA